MVEQVQPIQASDPQERPDGALPVEESSCIFCQEQATAVVARGRDYEYASSPDYFELVQCRGCELMFIQPRPAAEAMSAIYPSNYYAYNEEAGENAFVKYFRDRIERGKVRRYEGLATGANTALLDVGCGDGRLLDVIRRFAPRSWQLAGIEIAESAADRAAARGFEVKSGDFESLEVGDWEERFDIALMHHVIEHVRDPRAVLRKVSSLMAEGGVFSVETPDIRGWDFSLFRDRYWGGYHIPRHFYLFNAATLTRLLREEGFEILSVRSIPSPAFWIFSLHNYLVDRSWGARLARYCHPQNLLTRGQSTNLQVLARKTSERSSA